MLRGRDATSRVVILLTDGVNNAGQIDPVTAARAAAALDVKIYAIGMAQPGQVLVPVDDPLLGRTTRLVQSEIDEETLQMIAHETGGLYFRAQDTAGLRKIYEQIDFNEGSRYNAHVTRGSFGWVNGVKDTQVVFHPDPNGRFSVSWVPPASSQNRQIIKNGRKGNTASTARGE